MLLGPRDQHGILTDLLPAGLLSCEAADVGGEGQWKKDNKQSGFVIKHLTSTLKTKKEQSPLDPLRGKCTVPVVTVEVVQHGGACQFSQRRSDMDIFWVPSRWQNCCLQKMNCSASVEWPVPFSSC